MLRYFLNNRVVLVGLVTLNVSCGVISLEEDAELSGNQSIAIQNIFPANPESFNTILTNESSKTWRVTGFTLGESVMFQTCRIGDEIVLNANGTYQYDGGNQLCGSEDDKQIKSGTWTADFDARMLYFDQGTQNEIEFRVETCEALKVIVSSHYFGIPILGRFEI